MSSSITRYPKKDPPEEGNVSNYTGKTSKERESPASSSAKMKRLADEAFPDQNDPMQQELWTEYMRLATAFIGDAMALNQKVILEGTRIEKARINRHTFQNRNNDPDEDEDVDAERYSLF